MPSSSSAPGRLSLRAPCDPAQSRRGKHRKHPGQDLRLPIAEEQQPGQHTDRQTAHADHDGRRQLLPGGMPCRQPGARKNAEKADHHSGRRKLLLDGLAGIDGIVCSQPEGAFYVFPCIKSTGMKSSEFCEKLIYSKKVAVVPGSAFGESGEGYVRVSYAYSVQHITTALQRIKEFVEELKK